MKKYYLLIISLICLNLGYSQTTTLAGFDTENINGSAPAIAIANKPTVGFTRGPGISYAGNSSRDYYMTTGWDANSKNTAKTNGDYIEWSITNNSTTLLIEEINELSIRLRNSNNKGPQKFEIWYSKDGFMNETQLTPGTQPLKSSLNPPKSITVEFTFNDFMAISTDSDDTISFRLYAWDADEPISGGLHILSTSSYPFPGTTGNGSVIKGTVTSSYDGLLFADGTWFPEEPSIFSENENALVLSGTYNERNKISLANLTVNPGAGIVLADTGSITVSGDLITADNVILESTSKQYSSLIVEGNVTGSAQYKRFVNKRSTAGLADGNDLISAPVTGEAFNDFHPKNPNIRQSTDNPVRFLFGPFDKSNDDYTIFTAETTDILEPGIGYRAASNTGSTFTFTGDINTKEISVDITVSDNGIVTNDWNLIGNPYPSYIDAVKFLVDNETKFESQAVAIYGYTGEANGWEPINKSTIQSGSIHRNIAPGQGFYVASKAGGGEITFSPFMRNDLGTDDFIIGRMASPENLGFIKLKVSSGTKNHHTELYFNDESTRGLDPGYDARVYGSKAPEFSIYSHLVEESQGSDMAIQSLPYTDLNTGVSIPLGINVLEGQQVTVSISESDLPEGIDVQLEDNVKETFTMLNTSDYTFTSSVALTDIGRFFLHISNRALSTPDNELNGLQIYTAANKTLYIKGLIPDNVHLNIYDLQGRMITTSQLQSNTNSNEVDMSNLSTGIYVVELRSSALLRTQKVILK